jgi:hypothetical protein
MKSAVFAWAAENKTTTLPHYNLLEQFVCVRDFERWAPEDTDTEAKAKDKAGHLKRNRAALDFLVDRLLPAVAGPKMFPPNIRHFEPVITSLVHNSSESLRITASTEAMAITMYKNCCSKFEQTIKWEKKNGKAKKPSYSAKNPEVNIEWMTPFSTAHGGQQEFGGWNLTGRTYYHDLQAKIMLSREKNRDRHLREDMDCCQRLQLLYSDLYDDEENPRKKPRRDDQESVVKPKIVMIVEK